MKFGKSQEVSLTLCKQVRSELFENSRALQIAFLRKLRELLRERETNLRFLPSSSYFCSVATCIPVIRRSFASCQLWSWLSVSVCTFVEKHGFRVPKYLSRLAAVLARNESTSWLRIIMHWTWKYYYQCAPYNAANARACNIVHIYGTNELFLATSQVCRYWDSFAPFLKTYAIHPNGIPRGAGSPKRQLDEIAAPPTRSYKCNYARFSGIACLWSSAAI